MTPAITPQVERFSKGVVGDVGAARTAEAKSNWDSVAKLTMLSWVAKISGLIEWDLGEIEAIEWTRYRLKLHQFEGFGGFHRLYSNH